MNEAYKLGYEIASENRNLSSNPYVRGTGSWSEFRRGWRDYWHKMSKKKK
jgi:hypothetical protein